jgi:pimeloyl-ACP methyl ester carboxylesterase
MGLSRRFDGLSASRIAGFLRHALCLVKFFFTASINRPSKVASMNRFRSFDGVEIAWREIGQGRPTLMLHGFLADARRNWIAPGIAAKVAHLGRRVILPDLRGHGDSGQPAEAEAWPADALARDQEALIAHLGLETFDLVGYSLGARTGVRMLVRGARPGKAVLAGMGLSGLRDVETRRKHFASAIANSRGRVGRTVFALMAAGGLKSEVMLRVFDSVVASTTQDLKAIPTPILVVSGRDDEENGSAESLAAVLPHARAQRVEGDHISAVMDPSLGEAICAFLGRA